MPVHFSSGHTPHGAFPETDGGWFHCSWVQRKQVAVMVLIEVQDLTGQSLVLAGSLASPISAINN